VIIAVARLLWHIIGYIWDVCKGKWGDSEPPEYHIHLCMPLVRPGAFDPEDIMQRFKARWGIDVGCSNVEEWSQPKKKQEIYLLGNGKDNLRITVAGTPLSKDLKEVILRGAPDLGQEEVQAVKDHAGYYLLDYILGDDDSAEPVYFTAKALMIFLEDKNVIGFANIPAMLYQPREKIESILDNLDGQEFSSAELFLLFVTVHLVDEDGKYWIHTHGMEQFGLPDIQMWYADGDKYDYYEFVGTAAAYMIDNGPVLKPSDTAELTGDGIIYKIESAEEELDHPFGEFGSILIVPVAPIS